MSDDLRTLAQAVVDAEWHWQETGTVTTDPHLTELLNAAPAWLSLSAATSILTALNAADAQGYARAMGEVGTLLDSLSDAAVATYQEHRTEYADGVADGSVEAWQAVRKLAERD